MCCRLQPVPSRLSSDSCWDESSLACTFLRSFGLAETQQEAVLPISAPGGNQALDPARDPALDPAGHPIPLRRSVNDPRSA